LRGAFAAVNITRNARKITSTAAEDLALCFSVFIDRTLLVFRWEGKGPSYAEAKKIK